MRKERKRGRERAREKGERRKKCLYTSVKLFISVYLCVSTSTDSVNYRFEKKKSKQDTYVMKTKDMSKNTTKQYRAMIRDYKRLRVPIINNDYDDDDNDCEL